MVSMYEKIFGNYPQVKVINYLLINPKRTYTKKQIAIGAKISRVTLDSLINNLEDLNILNKENLTYKLNLKSKLVKLLVDTQIEIAELVMNNELNESNFILGEIVTDEEFDEFIDSFDYEFNEDTELEKIERNDHITITRREYELLKSKQKMIYASQDICTDVIINAYCPDKLGKRMINYG